MASDRAYLIIRADGSTQRGLGHLYRSAALADMLRNDFQAILAYREAPDEVEGFFPETFKHYIDLSTYSVEQEALGLVAEVNKQIGRKTAIYLLDGYQFDDQYQTTLKQQGLLLACIDDIHAYPFVCDLLINHASSARRDQYNASDYTQFLLGLPFALTRSPFRQQARSRNGAIGSLNDVFVCLGGADPLNLSLDTAKTCLSTPTINIHVVLGPAHPSRDSLTTLQNTHPNRLHLYHNLSAEAIAELMAHCGIGVTSPSGVALEYLSTGGHLFLRPFVDNQQEFYADVTAKGLALPYADFPQGRVDQGLVTTTFDGRQAERFRAAFQQLLTSKIA